MLKDALKFTSVTTRQVEVENKVNGNVTRTVEMVRDPVYVMADIVALEPEGENRTRLHLEGGTTLLVYETADEVDAIISPKAKARAAA